MRTLGQIGTWLLISLVVLAAVLLVWFWLLKPTIGMIAGEIYGAKAATGTFFTGGPSASAADSSSLPPAMRPVPGVPSEDDPCDKTPDATAKRSDRIRQGAANKAACDEDLTSGKADADVTREQSISNKAIIQATATAQIQQIRKDRSATFATPTPSPRCDPDKDGCGH